MSNLNTASTVGVFAHTLVTSTFFVTASTSVSYLQVIKVQK